MPAKQKYDWVALELEYVTSDISLRDMSKMHNIPLPTIRDQSKKKHWPKKRATFRSDIVTEASQKKKTAAVMDKVAFDDFADRTCDIAVAKVAKEITHKYNLELETDGLTPLSMKAVQQALDVVDRAQAIKYRRLGIPPPKHIDADAADTHKNYQEAYAKELARLEFELQQVIAADGDGDGKGGNSKGEKKGKDGDGTKDELRLVPYDYLRYKVRPPGTRDNS